MNSNSIVLVPPFGSALMYGSIVEKICSTKELQLGNYHREITAADNLYRKLL
jgi:hypothetical protein